MSIIGLHEQKINLDLIELNKLEKGDKKIEISLMNKLTQEIKNKYEKYIKAVEGLELDENNKTGIELNDILGNANYFYISEDLKYFSFKIFLELLINPNEKLVEQKNNIQQLIEKKENYTKK